MDIESIPPKLNSAQRTARLEQLKGYSSLEIDELRLFEWYFNETESITQTMFAAEKELLSEQMLSENDLNDSGIIAIDYFLRRERYSHIIYLASLLESIMKRECKRLTDVIGSHNTPFKVEDLKGDSWSVRRKILERYGRFVISKELWQPILQLLNIRNLLVHEYGEIEPWSSQKRAELSKIDGVNVINDSEIIIEASYIKSALAALRELTDYLHNQVQDVIDRAIRPKPIC